MRRRLYSLFGFCLFAAVSLLQVESCQQDKLKKCAEPLTSLPQTKFIYTKEEIQHTCNVIDEFVVCIGNTGCDALSYVATLVDGLQKTADYICVDRFDEYMKHERCLNSENVEKSAEFCAEEAKAPEYSDCKNKSSVLSCYVRSVASCCGREAGNFTDGFMKVMLQTTTSIDCQLQSDLDGPTSSFCSTASTSSFTASTSGFNVFVFSIAFILFLSLL